ncbi:MAG: NAD(P)/FAD-dependent oxidoreductase [Bacteroidota bacterium]
MKPEHDILIIGAGAAGLYAGHVLQKRGISFRILEAADRIGGRLGKLTGFADYPLDLGAEWLHGKKSLIGKLIKKTGTSIKKDKSTEVYWFQGKLIEEPPRDVWAIFDKKRKPDISYFDYATEQGFGEDYRYIIEAIAGDQGADSTRLSAYWNAKEEEEWSSGEKDYKFQDTYFDLINKHIATPLLDKISLHTIIKRIDYREQEIFVKDSKDQIWRASHVILTVPIPVLKDGAIEFVPPLPSKKTEAFQQIGMDAGMKVFLKFSEKFYHQNIIGGRNCAAYADEIIGKEGQDHVLMAFVMGKQAEYLSSLEEEAAIVHLLLTELDEMYAGQASASFVDAYVMDWSKQPFIRGAYSYSTIGIGNARAIAAQSIDDKLFFAGEAMNLNGHHQTVHGAAETGIREAKRVLKLKELDKS